MTLETALAATGDAAPINAEDGGAADQRATAAGYWALLVIVLATFITFFDQVLFGMLAERIKHDFGLTDSQLGFLAGPAGIICYLFVGIPLARLADIYPRKYVLAGGVAVIGTIISLGGLAQNFAQFVGTRIFLAAGGSAHAPSSYSLLADAFPPRRLTRAFALLQFGFIGGTTLGPWIGGMLVMMAAGWAPSQFGPLRIFGWQWVMIVTGLPALLVALLFLTVREPSRQAPPPNSSRPPLEGSLGRKVLTFMGLDAFRAINARPQVFYPLFGALALSAIDVFGMQFWRTPFLIRTYGWNEAQIGRALGGIMLVSSLSGLLLGGVLVEWLAKRYKDANVRAAAICFAGVTVCSILSPLMPSAELSLAVMAPSAAFGMAGAVPQNAAVQRIAPNALRGQVTAIYLFMFTFFGAMGSFFIGLVQDFVIVAEQDLWKSLVLCAGLLMPLATYLMVRAMRPYREELERLEAQEVTPA
ncbi:MFS transporter [Novosphingobium flavum]|uniref:MFS transporter n=2 Tax=Novosphingobium aerophilum TaxID=2839843 RepID=A0A7X1F682_9SPHN|nr:MFS transporter [Novosphingobium aerophilum]MBC2660719.1 MFS transporter [Novosphingobium aerophilum]